MGLAALMSFMTTFALAPLSLVAHSEAHKRAKEQGPIEQKVVSGMRKLGLLVTAKEHLKGHHGHGQAHASSSAALTGESNKVLDGLGFYRKAEKAIFATTGVMPRCWQEADGGRETMEAALQAHPKLKAKAEEQLARS